MGYRFFSSTIYALLHKIIDQTDDSRLQSPILYKKTHVTQWVKLISADGPILDDILTSHLHVTAQSLTIPLRSYSDIKDLCGGSTT